MGKLTRRGTLAASAAIAVALSGAVGASANVDGEPIDIDGPVDVETPDNPSIYRFAGPDRVATAIQAYERTDSPAWGNVAIVANSEVFADALAAAPLADALDAPVFLNAPGNSLRGDVRAAVDDFSEVVIVGGTDVFGNGVNTQLENAGLTVHRVHGANRYQTAIELAAAAIEYGDYDAGINVFLADGTNFPDALTAGAAAADTNGVVLLTKGAEGLDSATYGALTGLVPGYSGPDFSVHNSIVAIGGPAAAGASAGWLADPVETDFDIIGADRYQTALEVAETYVGDADNFVIASGENFPDAVVGGAYAANIDGALLLTKQDSLTNAVGSYLEDIRLEVENVIVFGGPQSIAPSVSVQIAELDWRY